MDIRMIFKIYKMRMEKENDFSCFSKLLRQIDAKNVGLT